MNLTENDFNNRIFLGLIENSFYFDGTEVFMLNNSRFYKRLDNHPLGTPRSNEKVGLYLVSGHLVILLYHNNHYTYVSEVSVIESQTREQFTGFEVDKIYELTNNQSWRQTSGPNAPSHHSGGNVRILEGRIKVDNWEFYPQVERIK